MTPRPTNPFANLKAGDSIELPSSDAFLQAHHLWSAEEKFALTAAFAADRPLLVRGEAGSGKSQIARAASQILNKRDPITQVIHPRFEALDLLYKFDAVERLADAQPGRRLRPADDQKYLKQGRLWEAMEQGRKTGVPPVLLIDEIDKADADVPNSLLDVLGNRSFDVPHRAENRTVRAAEGAHPLIIITTNEERELPSAFVRRCFVLNLNPPEGAAEFKDWLLERGKVHRHLEIDKTVRSMAAEQVHSDRIAARDAGYPPVGLAEYIDLLTALHQLTVGAKDRSRAQAEWMEKINAFVLVKHAKQDQRRKSAADPSTSPT